MSVTDRRDNRREDALERDRAEGRRSGVEEWRGVAAEHNDEIADRASGFLKKRSRALLVDLARILALRLRMASDVIAELRG